MTTLFGLVVTWLMTPVMMLYVLQGWRLRHVRHIRTP